MNKAHPHLDPYNKRSGRDGKYATWSTWHRVIIIRGFHSSFSILTVIFNLNMTQDPCQHSPEPHFWVCNQLGLIIQLLIGSAWDLYWDSVKGWWVEWTAVQRLIFIYSLLHKFIFSSICPILHALFMWHTAPPPELTQPIRLLKHNKHSNQTNTKENGVVAA